MNAQGIGREPSAGAQSNARPNGIPDFQAPPPIPKFIDASHAIDELPSYDSFEPSPDDF